MKKTILFFVGLLILSLHSNAQLVCDPVSPNLVSNPNMDIHGPIIVVSDDQALTNVCAWDKAVPTNSQYPCQGAWLWDMPWIVPGPSQIRVEGQYWNPFIPQWGGFFQSIDAKNGTTITLDINLLLSESQSLILYDYHFVVCLTNANVLDQSLYINNYLDFDHQVLLDENSSSFTLNYSSWQNIIIPDISVTDDYTTLAIYMYKGLFSEDTEYNNSLLLDNEPAMVSIDWINIYQHELTANAGEDQAACLGEDVKIGGILSNPTAFGGVPPYTYSWTSDPPGYTSTLENPVLTPSQSATYIVEVRDKEGPQQQIAIDKVYVSVAPCGPNKILRVDITNANTATNDGSSWDLAFTHLQDALSAASNNPEIDQIWIAEGTYYPDWDGLDYTGDRDAKFSMLEGVAIYGGFKGDELILGERNEDPEKFPTVLSGNIKEPLEVVDNSYTIVSYDEIIDGILDRVTIEKAYNYDQQGPAFVVNYSTVYVNNCTVKNNMNGAIGIDNSEVYFQSSVIEKNQGIPNLFAGNSSVKMVNCRVQNNSGTGMGKGVLYFRDSEINMLGCLIKSNELSSGEGITSGVLLNNSTASIVDCDFIKNTTESNGPTAICITDDNSYSGSHEINVLVQRCRFEGTGYENNFTSPTIKIGLYGQYVDNPAQVTVENSVFYNNTPPLYSSVKMGSGTISVLLLDGIANDKIKILNNTFYSAEAAYYGGYDIYAYFPIGWNDHITVTNCILWDGSGHNKIGTFDGSMLPVTYSDIEGGYGLPTDNNIDENPLYADALHGDFHLRSIMGRWDPNKLPAPGWIYDDDCSPCIDAGDPYSGGGGTSELGIPNMGAYGNTNIQSKTCPTTKSALMASDDSNSMPETVFGCVLSPNPISQSLKIDLNLTVDCKVDVSIYNMMGRKSKTISCGYLNSGNTILYWNGEDDANNQLPNGIYLVMVKSNNTAHSYKVLLKR